MPSDIQPRRDLCPVDADTQKWIDARASWIVHQFGWERITSCPIVLPTPEFFPDAFCETEADARVMLNQLCRFLGIESQRVELIVFSEPDRTDGGSTSAGLFEQVGDQFRVWIESSLLHEPLALAATIAHELCHVHLLGHRRLTTDEDDHEPLTDLLSVFLGLGVFLANAALHDKSWHEGNWEGWRIHRQGYLTMPIFGYALALFSRIRGEDSANWARHLRADVREAFHKSLAHFALYGLPELRSLTTTSARPTLFRPESSAEGVVPQSEVFETWKADSAVAVCSFCGTTLRDDSSNGLCDECRISVDENRKELDYDRQRQEAAGRTKQIVLRCGCLLFVIAILIIALFEWLDIFP